MVVPVVDGSQQQGQALPFNASLRLRPTQPCSSWAGVARLAFREVGCPPCELYAGRMFGCGAVARGSGGYQLEPTGCASLPPEQTALGLSSVAVHGAMYRINVMNTRPAVGASTRRYSGSRLRRPWLDLLVGLVVVLSAGASGCDRWQRDQQSHPSWHGVNRDAGDTPWLTGIPAAEQPPWTYLTSLHLQLLLGTQYDIVVTPVGTPESFPLVGVVVHLELLRPDEIPSTEDIAHAIRTTTSSLEHAEVCVAKVALRQTAKFHCLPPGVPLNVAWSRRD